MIELTQEEINVIEKQLAGKIDAFLFTEQEQKVLMAVIDKAEKLVEETNEWEESSDDMIAWFYNKYKNQ